MRRTGTQVPYGATDENPKSDFLVGPFSFLKNQEKNAKAAISRHLTELKKRKQDRPYLEEFHGKIDYALKKLQKIKEAINRAVVA